MSWVIKYDVLEDSEEDSNGDCNHDDDSDNLDLAIFDRIEIVGVHVSEPNSTGVTVQTATWKNEKLQDKDYFEIVSDFFGLAKQETASGERRQLDNQHSEACSLIQGRRRIQFHLAQRSRWRL
jgi:hypothetical protein